MKTFTEEMRYEYPLTAESLVIDIGAHEGKFSAEINRRYGCRVWAFEPVKEFYEKAREALAAFPNVELFDFGVGTRMEQIVFGVKGGMTGAFTEGNRQELVYTTDISNVLEGVRSVDLIKINIEGGEYDLLEAIIDRGLHLTLRNIQVQFHSNIPDCERRWKAINERLLQTHRLTYLAPFCWENYALIEERSAR